MLDKIKFTAATIALVFIGSNLLAQDINAVTPSVGDADISAPIPTTNARVIDNTTQQQQPTISAVTPTAGDEPVFEETIGGSGADEHSRTQAPANVPVQVIDARTPRSPEK